ncbi:response regulator [Futiania mangrovi]|uniref:Response regulator transcription factor n=1 Tax=Futiania mangrovi TaxID=2959716 RepID=A0A9J6PLD6_9PROT|nr:response regulator transcription factor [Futiania mangrovii]MCP1336858.1 response regulator transcription factor [Futiania mangrovii]
MTDADQVTILIADDHPLFRGALAQAIASRIAGAQVLEAEDFGAAQRILDTRPGLDLCLLDINMPGMRGFTGLLYVRAQYPDIPVMIVSAIEDEEVIRAAFDYGAAGYIPKSLSVNEIGTGIRAVLDGESWLPPGVDLAGGEAGESADLAERLASLTPQQVRVLMLLSEGKLNKQIAYELSISEATVKAHVSAILQKLGVNSRTQAVIIAGRMAVEDKALSAARDSAIHRQT